MNSSADESGIFPKGEPASPGYFTGAVSVNILVKENVNNYSVADVRFEAGARTNWHTHPAGQILLVTEGNGWYQEKDKSAQTIKKGDVVTIPANIEHWHGATATSAMTHIAISNFKESKNADWLAPVTNEEYNRANEVSDAQ